VSTLYFVNKKAHPQQFCTWLAASVACIFASGKSCLTETRALKRLIPKLSRRRRVFFPGHRLIWEAFMSIDDYGTLSAEDAALFETAVCRRRRGLDGGSLRFIALLILISMLAGFCGGLPLALASHPRQETDACAYNMRAEGTGAGHAVRASDAYDEAKRID
jgi:hypothetical protein